jgi:Protein of unknown function (DUF2889)
MSENIDNKNFESENLSGSEITREELHLRQIDIRGFRRSDGMFEVEGRVVDRKTQDLSISGRIVPAGTAFHNMGVLLVFDGEMVVHDVTTFTDAAPYDACPAGGLALKNLIGLSMTSGWNKEVRNRIAKAKGCTHLVELLGPMATVAYQSVSVLRPGRADTLDETGRPAKIDSCYAYAADGKLVRDRWPNFYRPKQSNE